jgi:hypothetical protein
LSRNQLFIQAAGLSARIPDSNPIAFLISGYPA